MKKLTPDQIIALLLDRISSNYVHRYWKDTKEYAEKMTKLISGKDIKSLRKQFMPRETIELFNQRDAITQDIVKPMAAKVMNPVKKISRTNPIVNEVTYTGTDAEANAKELKLLIDNFYGDKSLDDYLGDRFLDYQGMDPNAWMIILFNEFDYRWEKPKPYGVVVSAEQAIDWRYVNNELDYLLLRTDINYRVKDQSTGNNGKQTYSYKPGYEFQLYLPLQTIMMIQVDPNAYPGLVKGVMTTLPVVDPQPNEPANADFYRFDDERVFKKVVYEHKCTIVPAFRIGALNDPSTKYETCVSILDKAEPYFMKAIALVSEFDLGMRLHAFPQKIVYVPECPGAPGLACIGGNDTTGKRCEVCKGTGKTQTHTTTQDVIELKLPDVRNIDKAFDLAKLVHYVTVPVDVVKFQKDVIDELLPNALSATYNTDVFTKSQVQQTGIEKRIDLDNVYDTLTPIATHYSFARTRIILIMADYIGKLQNLVVNHRFSKDFKYQSLLDLLDNMKSAKDSDAPSFVKQDISRDIALITYADRPDELKRFMGRQRFDPFEGLSESIITALLGDLTSITRYSKTLFAESKRIYLELEMEASQKKDNQGKPILFWDLEPIKQYELLKAKVEEIIVEIDEDNKPVTAIPFDPHAPAPQPGPGGPADPNNPADPKNPAPAPEPNNPPADQNPAPGN